jgi:GT2 family glycosyltransferase
MSAEHPSVLVLLVASNGEPWLPAVVDGLKAQTWDDVEVLAVDNASTDRSRALLEKAFGREQVVSLDRRVGYGRALAAALKVASDRGTPADAFLLLHDDAAMDPGAVEALVGALTRERVGIVGAKLLEWDSPEKLQEVGLTTDRFGRLFNPLERGELDQGQHDGLKEVFFSSSACLLVARGVVETVGLLDLRYVALRDDFDFCWRARVAGFRSVVTSEARVRHAVASYRQLRPGAVESRVRYFSERNMIASLIKNYSIPYLAVALPVTLAISIVNSLLFLLTGRRRAARQILSAVQWNLVHLPSTLRARARSQRRRRTPDAEVVRFMVRGVPRVRTYVERALEQVVGEPAVGIEESEGLIVDAPRARLRDRIKAHPIGITMGVLAIAYLIGARHLYGSGGLAGRDLAPFPGGPGDFFREFFSGWRTAGTGGAAPASPSLLLSGLLSVLTFGSTRIAERILYLSLLPLAAGAAWRLAGALELPARARRVSALAYGLSPLALAAFSQGRLSDLVLAAALPVLLLPVLRAAGLAPPGGWRSFAAGTLGLAVVASIAPWALVAVVGSSIVVALGLAITGGGSHAGRAVGAAFVQTVGALLLLLPWSVELFRPGSPLGSRPGPLGAGATDLIRLLPHPPGGVPGSFAWAFPAAAGAGLVLAAGARERAARVLAIAGTASVLLAWAVARGVPWIAPRPGLPLVLAVVCMAMLVGFAAEAIVPALSSRSFGGYHLALGGLAVYAAAALAIGVGFVARGHFDGLQRSGALAPAFFAAEKRELGDFRVLWVSGSRRALHADLTAPEGETMLTYDSARTGPGEKRLEQALAAVVAQRTEHAGRLLAPLGVRYVVLRPGADPVVERAFARQTDVHFSQRFHGSQIVANDAWLPVASSISSPLWIAASRASPARASDAVASAPDDPGRVSALRRVRPGAWAGSLAPASRYVVLGEEFSPDWKLVAGGQSSPAVRSFGWATAFRVPGVAAPAAAASTSPTPSPSRASPKPAPTPAPAAGGTPVAIAWTGRTPHLLALLGELVLLLALATAWSRRAATDRGER